MADLRRDWRPALISALVALSLYSLTLGGTYVYDDRYIVGTDPRLAHPAQWGQYWTKDYFNGGPDNLYRPLVSMSYAIQWWLHGNSDSRAWLFHLVNLLLFAGTCAGVAEFTRRLAGSRIALIAGIVYAAHPIHVEAVANIVGRAELACGLGIILGLVLLLRKPMTVARAFAIWSCFILALLSKEQGMLLPLALALAWPLRRFVQPKRPPDPPDERAGRLALIMLLTWTLAGYIIFRENILKFWWDRSFLDWTINPVLRSTGPDRILLPLALFGRYIALLFAPVHLSLDYGARVIMPHVSPRDPYLYLGFIAAAVWLIAFGAAVIRRGWLVAFCLLAFGIFYGVVSNIPTLIGVDFAERLMYIPSIFICILIAWLLARLRRTILVPAVSVIVILLSLRTVTYAWQWNDRLRLYEYVRANAQIAARAPAPRRGVARSRPVRSRRARARRSPPDAAGLPQALDRLRRGAGGQRQPSTRQEIHRACRGPQPRRAHARLLCAVNPPLGDSTLDAAYHEDHNRTSLGSIRLQPLKSVRRAAARESPRGNSTGSATPHPRPSAPTAPPPPAEFLFDTLTVPPAIVAPQTLQPPAAVAPTLPP